MTSRAERQQAEIIEVEHLILSPVIYGLKVLKFIFRCIALVIILILSWSIDHMGWVVGWGDNGYEARQEAYREFTLGAYKVPDLAGKSGASLLDFRSAGVLPEGITYNPPPTDEPTAFLDAINVSLDNPLYRPELPALCLAENVVDRKFNFNQDKGPWEGRGARVIQRTSTRMTLPILHAQIMSTLLRQELAIIASGKQPRFKQEYRYAYCYQGYFQDVHPPIIPDAQIKISQAPVVRIRMSHEMLTGVVRNEEYMDGSEVDMYFDHYSQIFSEIPPVTPAQEIALDALDAMSTDAFWIATAHENHIYKDAQVRSAAAAARQLQAKIMQYAEEVSTQKPETN